MNSRVRKIIKNPQLLFLSIGQRGFFNWMGDESYLRIAYRARVGKKLHLDPPITFNEKLQWLKLHDRNPCYTDWVDKYKAKLMAAKIIGEEYIIPTLGVWEHFDEIDFDTLPDQFVLKCTHDSGGLVICKDKKKINREIARRKIEGCLRHNFFWGQREWPYKNVKPRIIAEQYMEDGRHADLVDYKIMCFHGEPKVIFTCTERYENSGLKVTFFDTQWNRLPFERQYPASRVDIERPQRLLEMLEIAKKLAKGIPFVRVDLYEIEDRIYFGEQTFFPGSGFEVFRSEEWDYKFGEWINLPK